VRAIQITEFGGPEVLTLTELPDPEPRDGLEVLDVRTAGINYADTHQVNDDYLSRQRLPMVPGGEVVGTRPDGTRVLAVVTGGYATKALAHPATSFPVPDGVDDAQALALLVQGLTAWHLLRTSTSQASREQPTPVDPAKLMRRSAAVIGFWLVHCMQRPDMLREPMAELLELVGQDRLRPVVGGHYPLAEARRAHEDLLARRTVGKLVLDM
jgi:NADPH:quinone reductase-like Zn-dependent oxidoreductase